MVARFDGADVTLCDGRSGMPSGWREGPRGAFRRVSPVCRTTLLGLQIPGQRHVLLLEVLLELADGVARSGGSLAAREPGISELSVTFMVEFDSAPAVARLPGGTVLLT